MSDAFITRRTREGILIEIARLKSVPFGEAYLRNRRIQRWGRSLLVRGRA